MNKEVFKFSILMLILGFVFLFSGMQTGGLGYLADADIDSYNMYKNEKINKYTKDLDKISLVEINLFNSNFEIRKSENGKNYIEYYAKNEEDYTIQLNNENLSVKSTEKVSKFSFKIGINLNHIKDFLINGKTTNESFILYLSESELEKLNFDNFSGNLDISDVTIKNININLKSGNCKLSNLNSDNIDLSNSAGNIYLENITNSNSISLDSKAGNIEVNNTNSNLYNVDNKAGNIKFKNIEVSSLLEVENKAGNIKCSLVFNERNNYDVDVESNMGNSYVDKNFYRNATGEKTVRISLKSKAGNVRLEKN